MVTWPKSFIGEKERWGMLELNRALSNGESQHCVFVLQTDLRCIRALHYYHHEAMEGRGGRKRKEETACPP